MSASRGTTGIDRREAGWVKIRWYIDSETGEPHIYNHGVTEDEVRDVLARRLHDRAGAGTSRVAIGQTRAGRFLNVVYVPDSPPGSIFVITSYRPSAKALKALRRFLRRHQ